jgi:hypothetical protein
MLSRRDLIVSGAAFGQLRPEAPQAQGITTDREVAALKDIADALKELRHRSSSPVITQLRDRQRTFLRLNQRYPEFIDVGVTVWERLQDWHVDNGQELKISRSPEGRYLMEFMLTRLVLRPEIPDQEVGMAYDR